MKKSIFPFLHFFILLQTVTTAYSQKAPITKNFSEQMVQAGFWEDTDGNFVNAHGGCMLYYQGIYYWYGEMMNGKTWLVPGQRPENYRVARRGISCYSSKNLKDWKFERIALGKTVSGIQSDPDTGYVMKKPRVIYNQKTKQFVMWMHMDHSDFSSGHIAIAVSNNPQGPFQYLESTTSERNQSDDINLFKDDDGTAFLIYVNRKDKSINISRLSNDYKSASNPSTTILKDKDREAPVMFRFEKKYYLITSASTGYSPSTAAYAVSDSPQGPWKEMGNPCIGPFSETTFSSQGTCVIPINTKKGKFLFMADRWNKTDLENSRYLWLPMEIREEIINITWSAKVPDL